MIKIIVDTDIGSHDAIAAAWLFDKSIVKTKRGKVKIGLQEDFAYTHFAEDETGNTEVVYDLDASAFFAHYDAIVRDRTE